jgi:flavoprotein
MGLDHVNKLLQTNELIIDLKRDEELRSLFKENEEEVLKRYKLTEKELEAIKQRDFKALYDIGIHQYLVAQLARLIYGTVDGSNDGGSVKILMDQMLSDEKG